VGQVAQLAAGFGEGQDIYSNTQDAKAALASNA
jgi:hypothetical protein